MVACMDYPVEIPTIAINTNRIRRNNHHDLNIFHSVIAITLVTRTRSNTTTTTTTVAANHYPVGI
jgi:hypothetical protein